MAVLLSCQDIAKAYGAQALFCGITMGFFEGERCGMFGPNGAGKSTLLKILAGREIPDEGTLEARRGVRVGYLAQQDVFTQETPREELLAAMAGLHLEEQEKATRAAIMLTKTGFADHEAAVGTLSGGWRKRLALARELVLEPDLLLLDEPTNHLDLDGIVWLEKLLQNASFAFVVVTHDRYFLDNVTSRIIEINRIYPEGYLSVPGSYADFLDRRETVLAAQVQQQQVMAGKAREEIAWLKREPEAQRTKNKSRIKDAHELLESLADVRFRNAQTEAVDIEFAATERKTRKLLTAHSLCKAMGDRPLIQKMNLVLAPGMKVGVLGPNGSGKSTLLRLLAGPEGGAEGEGGLMPDSGTLKRAPDLRVVFFDQQRQQVDRQTVLRQALSPKSDSVVYNGQLVHVNSWAKRFLFRYEQLDQPVGELSGGEQARVLIARLMLTAADILILDEPTNDLDIPSLEVLEESLEEFPGAIVLVTHDRYMLDRLATDIVGLDGNGGHGFFTDYEQYQRWADAREVERVKAERAAETQRRATAAGEAVAEAPVKKAGRKLTYKEQKEWETMEGRIMSAEVEVQKWHAAMEVPAVMADREKLTEVCKKVHDAQEAVAELYRRWEELEGKLNG